MRPTLMEPIHDDQNRTLFVSPSANDLFHHIVKRMKGTLNDVIASFVRLKNMSICYAKQSRKFRLKVYILILVEVQYAYQKQERHDCLAGNDLHSMETDAPFGSSIHTNCMEWCNINPNCGAFAVYHRICFFKGQTCRDESAEHHITNLFLKEGS